MRLSAAHRMRVTPGQLAAGPVRNTDIAANNAPATAKYSTVAIPH